MVVAVAGSAVVEGVGAIPAPPAPDWPQAPAVPASARAALAAEPLRLAADAETRRVEKLTLRIRNISCGQAAIGSGFALDAHTLITNRHVIAGAAALQADTWDGQTIDLDVSQAATGLLVDIGVIHVAQSLPVVGDDRPGARGRRTHHRGRLPARRCAHAHPRQGDRVSRWQHPAGGDRVRRSVMEVSAPVKHGNSGRSAARFTRARGRRRVRRASRGHVHRLVGHHLSCYR